MIGRPGRAHPRHQHRHVQGGREFALTKGIIIADTKFEFGLDRDGTLVLMDEVLTPDSSRYLAAESYAGRQQPAQLRQAVRARLAGAGRR
jgi:phosphoribosylaminoimidazole-succinocarboxamide synthase